MTIQTETKILLFSLAEESQLNDEIELTNEPQLHTDTDCEATSVFYDDLNNAEDSFTLPVSQMADNDLKSAKVESLYDLSVYDNEQLPSTPLDHGANTTILDAVVKYLYWFSDHPGISKEALSDMLKMQHLEVLPPGNKLPGSYCDNMKLVEPFLIQPILFHACRNDCIVFRGAYTDLNTCPTCNASRYGKEFLQNDSHIFQLVPGLQDFLELLVYL